MAASGVEKMGRVVVEVSLSNSVDEALAGAGMLAPDKIRRLQLKAIVDTGATRLVLPETVATQLGVPSRGQTPVHYAGGQRARREMVEGVRLELLGRAGTFSAIVEPERQEALLGAIVLEDLDFVVDCTTQTLKPRDPEGIFSEIE